MRRGPVGPVGFNPILNDDKEINLGTSPFTTVSDVYVFTTEEFTLAPGVWDLGYDITAQIDMNSGTSGRATIAIHDSSNNVIANTTHLEQWSNHISTSDNNGFGASRSTRITITVPTTYKLGVRAQAATAVFQVRIFGVNITGGLTDPDNASVFWARRVA